MPRTVNQVTLYGNVSCLLSLLLAACSNSGDNAGVTATGDPLAGKAAVTKYACTGCHSADLSGSTAAYTGTTAYPANLTPDKDTGLGDWDAAAIKTAILTGVDDEGKTLCATMPKFAAMNMSTTEAEDIVTYLKSLPAVVKDIPESVCGSGAAAGATK